MIIQFVCSSFFRSIIVVEYCPDVNDLATGDVFRKTYYVITKRNYRFF